MDAVQIRASGSLPTEWFAFDFHVEASDDEIALSGPAVIDLWSKLGAGAFATTVHSVGR